MRTHENIQEITTGQGDDCTAICLPEYTYFKKHCKMVQDIFIKRNQIIFVTRSVNMTWISEILKKMKKSF